MDIRIPREALEAGARALLLAETPVAMEWNYSISAVRAEYLDKARAAFTAMVEVWPDTAKGYSSTWWGQKTLMLPIGEENPDDKA